MFIFLSEPHGSSHWLCILSEERTKARRCHFKYILYATKYVFVTTSLVTNGSIKSRIFCGGRFIDLCPVYLVLYARWYCKARISKHCCRDPTSHCSVHSPPFLKSFELYCFLRYDCASATIFLNNNFLRVKRQILDNAARRLKSRVF